MVDRPRMATRRGRRRPGIPCAVIAVLATSGLSGCMAYLGRGYEMAPFYPGASLFAQQMAVATSSEKVAEGACGVVLLCVDLPLTLAVDTLFLPYDAVRWSVTRVPQISVALELPPLDVPPEWRLALTLSQGRFRTREEVDPTHRLGEGVEVPTLLRAGTWRWNLEPSPAQWGEGGRPAPMLSGSFAVGASEGRVHVTVSVPEAELAAFVESLRGRPPR